MPTFECRFTFGDIVFMRTDPEQREWIVSEIEFRPGNVVYHISHVDVSVCVYDFEVTDTIDQTKRLGISGEKQNS